MCGIPSIHIHARTHTQPQTLELVGVMNTAPYLIEKMIDVIDCSAFPHLSTLLVDDRCVLREHKHRDTTLLVHSFTPQTHHISRHVHRRLTSSRAAGFVRACGAGVRALRTLLLANQQGWYQWCVCVCMYVCPYHLASAEETRGQWAGLFYFISLHFAVRPGTGTTAGTAGR
jgi:hypothetical protein